MHRQTLFSYIAIMGLILQLSSSQFMPRIIQRIEHTRMAQKLLKEIMELKLPISSQSHSKGEIDEKHLNLVDTNDENIIIDLDRPKARSDLFPKSINARHMGACCAIQKLTGSTNLRVNCVGEMSGNNARYITSNAESFKLANLMCHVKQMASKMG